MYVLALALALQQEPEWRPGPADAHQSSFDDDGSRMAGRIRGDISKGRSEPLVSRAPTTDAGASPWRPVTDEEMRSRSGYWAPAGYRFHRSARADMDHDGRPDLVEMVTNGRQSGLRVTYANAAKPARIAYRSKSAWGDQGIFAAGTNAVMINQPEVNVYFIFQRGNEFRARYIGD